MVKYIERKFDILNICQGKKLIVKMKYTLAIYNNRRLDIVIIGKSKILVIEK